jgi:type II secretory pathway component PulK
MTALWHELTRRRGGRRRRRSGVALLMVVAVLMVMTTLITDVTYQSRVRLLVATHERDRVQAYYLARSGVLMYQLILVADRYVQEQLGKYLGMSLSLWQMVPVLNTGLMRMIFAAEGDQDAVTQDDVDNFLTTGQVSEAVADAALEEASSGVFGDKTFLDFTGDFSAELTDEDSKIAINAFKSLPATTDYTTFIENPTYLALMGLFSTDENEDWFYDRDLDRTELIANLADWIDLNTTRLVASGGDENSLYTTLGLEDDYMAKNGPFDSLEEIRQVAGWSDEVFDRFEDKLTVWGRGKINVCSLSDEMLEALLKASNPMQNDFTSQIEEYNFKVSEEGCAEKKSEWVSYWQDEQGLTISESIQKQMTTSSRTFMVKSTGLVDRSSVTITAIIDMSTNAYGDIVFWKEE